MSKLGESNYHIYHKTDSIHSHSVHGAI